MVGSPGIPTLFPLHAPLNALPKTFEVAVRFEVTVLSDILGTTVDGAEKKAEFCKFRGLGKASETL